MIQFRDVFDAALPSTGVAISAVQDVFEIVAPSNGMVALLALELFQTSDVGDAAEEILAVTVERAATSGSVGSAVTPQNLNPNGASFGGTVERNNTTRAGTLTFIRSLGWNVRAPLDKVWAPEEWIWVPPSGILVIGLPVAPADALTAFGKVTFGVL